MKRPRSPTPPPSPSESIAFDPDSPRVLMKAKMDLERGLQEINAKLAAAKKAKVEEGSIASEASVATAPAPSCRKPPSCHSGESQKQPIPTTSQAVKPLPSRPASQVPKPRDSLPSTPASQVPKPTHSLPSTPASQVPKPTDSMPSKPASQVPKPADSMPSRPATKPSTRPVAAPLRRQDQKQHLSSASFPATEAEESQIDDDYDDDDENSNEDKYEKMDGASRGRAGITNSGRFGLVHDPKNGKVTRLLETSMCVRVCELIRCFNIKVFPLPPRLCLSKQLISA